LHWQLQECEPHKQLREFYAKLLGMPKEFPALANSDMSSVEARPLPRGADHLILIEPLSAALYGSNTRGKT